MKKTALFAAVFLPSLLVWGDVAVLPSNRLEQVGDHLAFVLVTNGVAPLSVQWQHNGAALSGQTGPSLSLSNIQLTDAGTYTVAATYSGGSNQTTSAILGVSASPLPLPATNLIVARLGDGLQTLNNTTGNTLYLDQFATNGAYAGTTLVPDTGVSAMIEEGSGTNIGLVGSVLTTSANGQYLNFTGYNHAWTGAALTFTGATIQRIICAMDSSGNYTAAVTNNGLYNAATGQIRCAVSTDGTANTFWTAGIASAAATSIKIVTPGQSASGIPAANAGNDPRVLDIIAGNLWVSSGSINTTLAPGLYAFAGVPASSGTAALQFTTGAGSDPNDFAFSPDGLTVYVADSDFYTGATGVGGVQRWDYNGSAWVFAYSLGTGAGNWGTRGLTVDYSQFPGGGAGMQGAVVYATTAEAVTNRLIQIVDTNGANSTAASLAAAGPNQLFRGLRFGPAPVPAAPSAGQADLDEVNVKSYGARGDGVTDDTAAFANALVAGRSHDGVFVPMGKYVITGSLTVSLEELIGRFSGGWPADDRPMPTLLLRNLAAPGLILQNGAGVHGLALVYDQGVPASSNAPAVSLRGNGITLSSLRIENAYDGINTYFTSQPGRPRFSDIYILSPAHTGLQFSRSYDFNQFNDIEVSCPGAMCTGAGFVLDRMDEGSFTALVASNCAVGFEFDSDPSTNPAGGNFTGNLIGSSAWNCGTAMIINGPHKIKVTGGEFSGIAAGAVLTAANQIALVGGSWSASAGPAIQIQSATNVIIRGVTFSRPAPSATPLVTADNMTTLTLDNCQFLPGSTGLQLGANVARAVVLGNSFEDGGVSNFMTSGKFVVGTNLMSTGSPLGVGAWAAAGEVVLGWSQSISATNYHVWRATVTGGPYTLLAATAQTNYVDAAVSNGITYYYVITALGRAGESAYSAEVSATPQAPSVSLVLGAGNQLNLSWPGWAYDLTLYMTTNLAPPAVWQRVSAAAQSNNGAFNLTLPATNAAQEFFRLGPP